MDSNLTSKTYPLVGDGWESFTNPLHMACCDCSLVHTIWIRKTKKGFQLKIDRNNRATGQLRRHHPPKL